MRIKIFRNKTLIASREVSNLSKSKFEAFRKLLANRFNSPQTKGAGGGGSFLWLWHLLVMVYSAMEMWMNVTTQRTPRMGHNFQGRRAVVGLQGN